jgi:hypothetical protein
LHVPQILNAKEGLDNSGHYHQKDAAAKPGGSYFACILITGIPFLVNFDRPDQAEQSAYGVHQVGSGGKVTAYFLVGFIDTGYTVLSESPIVNSGECHNGTDCNKPFSVKLFRFPAAHFHNTRLLKV